MVNHELLWSTMNYHGQKPWCHSTKHGQKPWTIMVVHTRPCFTMADHELWRLTMVKHVFLLCFVKWLHGLAKVRFRLGSWVGSHYDVIMTSGDIIVPLWLIDWVRLNVYETPIMPLDKMMLHWHHSATSCDVGLTYLCYPGSFTSDTLLYWTLRELTRQLNLC